MTNAPNPALDKAKKPILAKLRDPNAILLVAGVIFVLVVSLTVKNFLSFRNITSVIVQISSTGLMAIGLTFVIITGGIDLSLPTVMALSAILGCSVMVKTQSVLLGMAAILAVALAIGCFIGFSISRLKMVPMIVTLAVGTMALGCSNWYTAARSISGMPKEYHAMLAGNIFGLIPVPAVILVAVAMIMNFVLSHEVFGRQLFQVGVNENTARVNGVKTTRIIFSIYVISSLTAGLAGIVASARLNSAGPSMGPQNMFMDVVAAVVIGGASVSGGKGSVIGTIIGSVFMGVISNIVNLLGLEYFMILLVKGAIIIAVAYFDILRNRGAAR
jgi:ribose/xylose/arabinose/galactoside ABC-type transport system permease subunit